VSELVYPPVIAVARGLFAAMGLRFTIEGAEHLPRRGGAVIASNHVSYLDFAFLGYAALPAGRKIRFMAKDAVFRNPIAGPLMRGMHHIPVDRTAGSAAFKQALTALALCKPVLDGDILSLDPSKLAHLLPERLQKPCHTRSSAFIQETHAEDFPCLLRLGEIRTHGIATVIVDKNYRAVTAITDRNVILVKGRVVFEGDSRALLAQPDVLHKHLGV